MGISANIKTIKNVLEKELCIPDYQRAYRWTKANVLQLMDDVRISMESGKQEYRVGSVILYQNATKHFEIVDGQQRLTTILLILLKVGGIGGVKVLDSLRYHGESCSAIRDNAGYISEWLADKRDDWKLRFVNYLQTQCKVAEIVVDDLSEAFQMFDTQNGRGKSLELYNLLKAYHIRALEQNTQDEKIRCDREWEDATQYDATPAVENDPNVDILKQLFSEQLFKSRLWCRGDICRADGAAKTFSKDDIEEFKGFTVDKNHPIEFPFQNPFLLQYMTEKFYQNVLSGSIGIVPRFVSGETGESNPFVNINQQIINGKAFFEYTQTYVDLYKKMFIELGTYQLADFKKFFYFHCLEYNRSSFLDLKDSSEWISARGASGLFRHTDSQSRRSGDGYLREVYKSLCFVLLDKFGEKVFNRYYETLYRLVYQFRLNVNAVKYQTAMKDPVEYFRVLDNARSVIDLMEFDKMLAGKLKGCKFNHVDKIKDTLLVKFIREGRLNEK